MPMSSALTAPTMKSSIKCTRTLISHCNSIINCAIGNTPTTACARTSRSPTSPHWNSSPVGKLIGERQSVTNLLDEYKGCLSPIILSPLNGQVKMSPHEQGDILIESERVATSGGDFSMYQGRGGVCQSRRAALLERAPDQAP